MLPLSPTLKAAQQQFDVEPVVAVLVGDVPPEAIRLSELGLVDAGSEGDVSFDACLLADGRIARARCDATGNVYVQVVAPGPGAAWSTWTLVGTAAYANGPVAIGAFSDGYLRLRWVQGDGHQLWETSTPSSGPVTWAAAYAVADAGAGVLVTGLACDGSDTTGERFFYAVSGGQLFETHLASGAWTAPLGDGGGYGGPALVAAGFRPTSAPHGDGNVYLLLSYGSPSTLLVKEYQTATSAWGPSTTLRVAGLNSGYSFGRPFLAETRADQLRQAVTWVETAPAPLGSSVQLSITPSHAALPGSLPFPPSAGHTLTHGLKVLKDQASPSSWWFVAADQVWSCPADSTSTTTGQRISFGQSQVVDFRIDQPGPNRPSEVQVTLLNPNGSLASAGQAGPYRGLRQWSQVALSVGYHSAAGDETIRQIPCWIESVTFRDDVALGQPLVILHCVDAWGILDRLLNRTAVTFSNASLDTILSWLWWHVCGDLDLSPPSSLSGVTLASFVVRAGESYGEAARRICERAGVILRFRALATSAQGVGWDSVGQSVVSWATGGSQYSYGPGPPIGVAGQHPIIQAHLAPLATPSATSVEVVGKSTSSLARNQAAINLLGHELVARVIDKTLDSQAKTDSTAAGMAGLLEPELRGGEITTLANVAIEIGDQIDLTVPTAGLNAGVHTVAGLLTSWSRDQALLQTLKLEGTN